MKEHNGITSYEAFVHLNCTRLSARIKDLRDEGHQIASVRETKKNTDGESVSYTRYVLAE